MTGHTINVQRTDNVRRSERREENRFKARANCFFRSFDSDLSDYACHVCRVENIGAGGMAFLSDQLCQINKKLLFTIALSDSYPDEPINALGQVVWINPSKSPEKYRIGIKFVNILKSDLLDLRRRID